jgi:hypothetical protein
MRHRASTQDGFEQCMTCLAVCGPAAASAGDMAWRLAKVQMARVGVGILRSGAGAAPKVGKCRRRTTTAAHAARATEWYSGCSRLRLCGLASRLAVTAATAAFRARLDGHERQRHEWHVHGSLRRGSRGHAAAAVAATMD